LTDLITRDPTDQPTDDPRRKNLMPPWPKGTSGRTGHSPRGKRYDELHAKLEAELGGNLTTIEGVLLDKAVTLLLRRPRNDADAVKLTSEARRILLQLRKDRAQPKPVIGSDLIKEYARKMQVPA
jgi:hypothetical protein